MEGIPVARLLDKEAELMLEVVSGHTGLDRLVQSPRIQKPGLALTGFAGHLHTDRIQVIGLTEYEYLTGLTPSEQNKGIRCLFELKPCVVVVTRGLEILPGLLEQASLQGVSLLTTPLMSSVFINRVSKFLETLLAPSTSLHGVFIEVLGVGILLLGRPGIGKSEVALELVSRGSHFIADDVVMIRKTFPDHLYGFSAPLSKNHLEVRGLGILNIRDLFGVSSVRESKQIELVVELIEWGDQEVYDRLGIEEHRYALLDVSLPLLRLPVHSGRSVSVLIEVAARNQLLKRQGVHSARQFQERVSRLLSQTVDFSPSVETKPLHHE